MYCVTCRKKTESSDIKTVLTKNSRWRNDAKCRDCKGGKSAFIPIEDITLLEATELHKPVIKRFPRRKIVTLAIDELWAADLVIMNKYVNENDGYKYILNVIDTFSKVAWAEPIKRKSGSDVTRVIHNIVLRAKRNGHGSPDLLHTDKGTEFRNKDFRKLLADLGTKMYHTENEEKSAIVERFNRTLNERMKVQFETRKSFRWVDILQGLIDDYNSSYHTTIRLRPKDVRKTDEPRLREMYLMKQPQKNPARLKVGDRVRIVRKNTLFESKYQRKWTTEIFRIVDVMPTAPVTYKISDLTGEEIIGSFYEKELQKTSF